MGPKYYQSSGACRNSRLVGKVLWIRGLRFWDLFCAIHVQLSHSWAYAICDCMCNGAVERQSCSIHDCPLSWIPRLYYTSNWTLRIHLSLMHPRYFEHGPPSRSLHRLPPFNRSRVSLPPPSILLPPPYGSPSSTL